MARPHARVQHAIVARAWRDAGPQPHRLERYTRSSDPDFEMKAADVIGPYLYPPQDRETVSLVLRGPDEAHRMIMYKSLVQSISG
jgi:hypothetical protein